MSENIATSLPLNKELARNSTSVELCQEDDCASQYSQSMQLQVTKSESNGKRNFSASKNNSNFTFMLNDIPPWYLCITYAIQHIFLTVGSIVGIPLLVSQKLCIGDDVPGNIVKGLLINVNFFVAGVCTFLQTTIGTRLPILQGNSIAYMSCVFAILALPHNQCPNPLPTTSNSSVILYNDTDGRIVDGEELWKRRMTEIQGAVIMGGILEMVIGLTGIIGYLMRFIGPLTVVSTITLIGLDLFTVIARNSESQWGIAIGTTIILVISSQYLTNVTIPFPAYDKEKKFHFVRVYVFKMFPILISLLIMWFLCYVFTITDVFPNDPTKPGYFARTDTKEKVLENSPWIWFPYPGQWGLPIVTLGGFFGIIAAVVASTIESIGDYYACAKSIDAPPPPKHAINRGIMTEGFGCIIAGLLGSGSGTTSFSQNIAANRILQVGSRRVMEVAGILLVIAGVFGKVGSLFVTVPDPVLGGVFLVMFGMVASIGLSNLQYVDLNSNRNLFIIGFTLLSGLTIANWMKRNANAIQTGVPELDQIFTVLLSSSLFIGCTLAIFFDNTLPGTAEERGLTLWNQQIINASHAATDNQSIEASYNLPFSTSFCWLSVYLPFLPEYNNNKANNSDTNVTPRVEEEEET